MPNYACCEPSYSITSGELVWLDLAPAESTLELTQPTQTRLLTLLEPGFFPRDWSKAS